MDVPAFILEHESSALHFAYHTGTLLLHECWRGSVEYTSVPFPVAARNQHRTLPVHVVYGSINLSLRNEQFWI